MQKLTILRQNVYMVLNVVIFAFCDLISLAFPSWFSPTSGPILMVVYGLLIAVLARIRLTKRGLLLCVAPAVKILFTVLLFTTSIPIFFWLSILPLFFVPSFYNMILIVDQRYPIKEDLVQA